MSEVLLEVKNLKKYFQVGKAQTLKAVDNVSFQIYKGETLGLVGESGCGKSTLGRTIMRLYHPTDGEVFYEGKKISGSVSKEENHECCRKMQMIFQDPYMSLDPRMKVVDIVAEGLNSRNSSMSRGEREMQVVRLMEMVGLQKEHIGRFAHEFSGGQRQRIGIARALAIHPEFIVADEPISALDVSIQAQVVNLLRQLQDELGLTYLFIAHDISMVKYISSRIGVMYLGSLVELAPSGAVFDRPLHPYTQALLSAIPLPDPRAEKNRSRIVLEGTVPSPVNIPEGCKFCSRCRYATDECKKSTPQFRQVEEGHWVACHRYANQ
ncbi:ABC transporter ATP-binding protein [Caproiciproducens faecalis]|uniref:ABC transporter ATP-binding protein n=1 Tax=Caproiciproducens faecalis TaxID=2820301 RepID=A0ABS7DKW8_9FIRM|nr:ABC transporter ATP-binding protein [Caproiciproducens faecalis]MBW7571935.1 ABC transporter ATP-binding protein [Caproiciproducens faecalis]